MARLGIGTIGEFLALPENFDSIDAVGRQKRKLLIKLRQRALEHVGRQDRPMSLEQKLEARRMAMSTPWTRALGTLSARIHASLTAAGLQTLGEVIAWERSLRVRAEDEPEMKNFGRFSRQALRLALERLAEVGTEGSGQTDLPDEPMALLELALQSLKPDMREMIEGRFVHGRTLESMGEHYVLTRERVRQKIAKGMKLLREQYGSRFREVLDPSFQLLEENGGLLHASQLEGIASSFGHARLALSVAETEDLELRGPEFLSLPSFAKRQTMEDPLARWLRQAPVDGWTAGDIRQFLELHWGMRLSDSLTVRLVTGFLSLEMTPMGGYRLGRVRTPQMVAELLRSAGRPLHFRHIARQLELDDNESQDDANSQPVKGPGPDDEEGDEDEGLTSGHRTAILRALLRSPDVLLWDKGMYVHRSHLSLPPERWTDIADWCARRLKGSQEGISTGVLLQELEAARFDISGLNPFVLRSLLGRMPGVRGLRKNWVAWGESFKEETRSLAYRFPEIAREWHPTRNGALTPTGVFSTSMRKVWWLCPKDSTHEYLLSIGSRTQFGVGCARCGGRWSVANIRHFVSSLIGHLDSFTPAELFLLFQQNGLLESSKRKNLAMALATGRFPRGELEKFIQGRDSLVDGFLDQSVESLEAAESSGEEAESGVLGEASREALEDAQPQTLPVVRTREVLATLDSPMVSNADEEAVQFLIASALAKLWKHAFVDEAVALREAEVYAGGKYAETVRQRFLNEYGAAQALPLPPGYAFKVDGTLMPPNLMQRFVASQVRDRRRVGNWSGTGSGKTLSAILASRVINARLSVICCPNAVVEGWAAAIQGSFPESLVATRTFTPDWRLLSDDPTGMAGRSAWPRYLVLNYEAFQQPWSDARLQELVERENVDFIIVDEVHYAKQRKADEMSLRKQRLGAMLTLAAHRNPELHVLGMSATPVINNLQEGKSLVELVTGLQHDDLETVPTVANCMSLHQRLVTLGTRWMPAYDLEYEELVEEVDCSSILEELRALGTKGNPLKLEQLLTRARLPTIRKYIQPKTLIYTHLIDGIGKLLANEIKTAGRTVGFYTGEDKSGLNAFIEGDLDVLIGTASIGTGVDGLQFVCNRLIINVLPWTHAEFQQLKGRLYRQGQREKKVTLVLPLTYVNFGEQRWSWCQSKMERLRFKKSISDAAVDGVVPEGHLRTPEQAYQDVMNWLSRLDTGEVAEVVRTPLVVPLPVAGPVEMERRVAYGDFSQMNGRWNGARSSTTHERLKNNPEEWAQYHTLYRAARAEWPLVPCEEMIRWCLERSGYVIGDFGCGEAEFARALQGRHTVHSFDHVALHNGVIACDVSRVPLEDGVLDLAVFSLSLMGSNFTDYLREAHRVLKLDGHLHIYEATSRFSDLARFERGLARLGFDIVKTQPCWKFTHIHALKTSRKPDTVLRMNF
ncbi:zinc-ribbon domain-containing protein [Archangium violaceum]|uniref:zinc-ribbon domain-containing protein n=1 Tax=Archangium violaceum TaxID=83451 RepID=UPI002B2C80CF|nr:zinc-ribbon domain-containing protein [Archangium gephyra]